MTVSHDLLIEEIPGIHGNIGLVTLNRPQALNALSYAMIQQLSQQLMTWKSDPAIKAVIVKSDLEKAFCAGGDIVAFHRAANEKKKLLLEFFYDEYRLNRLIHDFPKPYIALLHGITMGGGVGISIHGSHRVASESFLFAMPETGIGFFPDIGGSYFLSRLRDEVGIYLGLTGARLKTADAYHVGLVNHCIKKSEMPAIIESLAKTDLRNDPRKTVSQCLNRFAYSPEEAPLKNHQALISQCFKAIFCRKDHSRIGSHQ